MHCRGTGRAYPRRPLTRRPSACPRHQTPPPHQHTCSSAAHKRASCSAAVQARRWNREGHRRVPSESPNSEMLSLREQVLLLPAIHAIPLFPPLNQSSIIRVHDYYIFYTLLGVISIRVLPIHHLHHHHLVCSYQLKGGSHRTDLISSFGLNQFTSPSLSSCKGCDIVWQQQQGLGLRV